LLLGKVGQCAAKDRTKKSGARRLQVYPSHLPKVNGVCLPVIEKKSPEIREIDFESESGWQIAIHLALELT
jgi:hypothetical protein